MSIAMKLDDGLTPNMVLLRDRCGFDSVAERRAAMLFADLHGACHVLDVGTGSGWMAIVLAQAGHFVTSVDIDAESLARAEARARQVGEDIAGRIRFVEADATNLPFPAEMFSAVFTFDTIHHLPNCSAALMEMKRVCHSLGVVVVVELNNDGLIAVREVMGLSTGEAHEENACQLFVVEELVKQIGHFERHDLRFTTVFVVRPSRIRISHDEGNATA